jgi:leucyl aminopeptidase
MTTEAIEPTIHVVRGQRVILDAELAHIYGVTTKRLNEQVKRNLKRFPSDFMCKLTSEEVKSLLGSTLQFAILNRSQFATGSQKHRDPRFLPYAFTEHGALMAANVLNSERAVVMSVYVVRAFVKLRELLASSDELAKKLDELERKLTVRQDVHEKAILQLFSQIRELLRPPPPQTNQKRRRIGF